MENSEAQDVNKNLSTQHTVKVHVSKHFSDSFPPQGLSAPFFSPGKTKPSKAPLLRTSCSALALKKEHEGFFFQRVVALCALEFFVA